MRSRRETVEEVVDHAEHMPQGEHRHDVVSRLYAEHLAAVIHVAPKAAVGQHDAFRVARGAGRVVDDGQFVGRSLLAVADVFGAEVLGVAGAVAGVAVLEGFHQGVVAAHHRGEVFQYHNAFQQGHGGFVQGFPSAGADKEQFGFGVIDDVVDVVRLKLVQDGDDDRAISHRGQERHGPMGAVAPADGNLVARTDTGAFQHDVEFGNLPRHVLVLQGDAFVVGQGIAIPVMDDALLDVIYEGGCSFHVNRQSLYFMLGDKTAQR